VTSSVTVIKFGGGDAIGTTQICADVAKLRTTGEHTMLMHS
jgi:hypothetical protein